MTNVVVVLLDDLGFAQLGSYGSGIDTPAFDRLADEGLRYSRFHVTALCSPTRAALLAGRNHHAVGMGFLADLPTTHPGYTGRIPTGTPTLPGLLRDAGWSTMAVGKWHLLPRGERTAAGPFDRWPLGLGFERYYGFLRGDANHWAPELVRDNGYVDPPAGPDEGYHLTEDLADEAIAMVTAQQEAAPGKPFCLWFATGAMHAPHHVDRSWADRYAGAFDQGWDAWRDGVIDRQRASGVIPAHTEASTRPPWVPAWDDLDDEQRRLFARMMETYAGFLGHTDAQVGRLLTALEGLGVLDDTIVIALSDNGASAEGGALGTSNEHRFSHRLPETVPEMAALTDDWGGHGGYPHYAWGWAWAGNAPFRLWKRYAWLGGTRVPFLVRWPAGITSRGEVRHQFGHAVDVLPTVLDACGVPVPEGLDGASLRPTFDDPAAPAPRSTQYFEMLGSRSIVHDGWKATTDHVSRGVADEEELLVGSRDLDEDHWSLFRLDDDPAEVHDLADEHPGVLDDLVARWEAEAHRNQVFPLADDLVQRIADLVPPEYPAPPHATYVPAGGPVSDEALPMVVGGATVTAAVEVPASGGAGVLFAIGDHTSGFACWVDDGRPCAALSIAGDVVEVAAAEPLSPGATTVGIALVPDPGTGGARLDVVVDEPGRVVASTAHPHPLPFTWQHGGASLRLGHDRGFPVSASYDPDAAWNGGLTAVVVDTSPGATAPPAGFAEAALSAD
ncbi:MAG: arylsulfatase [Acidimicrobiales bacterium]|nr:arylsulfatase [Acidimicrobiales bacterium]